jgi:hypothetical protein
VVFYRDGATDICVGREQARLTPEQCKKYPTVCGIFHNIAPKLFGNGFFNLRLKGQDLGARVKITMGSPRKIREVYSSIGIGGQNNDRDCRFAVRKTKIIDKVRFAGRTGPTPCRYLRRSLRINSTRSPRATRP